MITYHTFHFSVPEAPPQHVRCEPLSAQSFRVWWEPPPPAARGGLLLGYEIMYQVRLFIIIVTSKQQY